MHGRERSLLSNHLIQSRIEHTIGKHIPGPSEDRAKSTVLARMQRVEGTMHDLGHTMENMFILLKHVDDKLEQVMPSYGQPTRSVLSQTNVHFSDIQEDIP